MNKNNLWFLTLFSLILILGVYYVTLPSDVFSNNETSEVSKRIDVDVSENNELVALRVERDERISSVMAELQDKIITSNSIEEKNSAFEELQLLNLSRGKETYLEDKLQDIASPEIRDEFIKLGQALKLAGIAASGIEAKMLIEDGMVLVNGETETRRGRKLRDGDTVLFRGETFTVRASE